MMVLLFLLHGLSSGKPNSVQETIFIAVWDENLAVFCVSDFVLFHILETLHCQI